MADEKQFQFHIIGPSGIEETFEMPQGTIRIGRAVESDLQLGHPYVSAVHAQILRVGDECELSDLHSRNGVKVNGAPIETDTPVTLSPGDEIEIWPFRLTLQEPGMGTEAAAWAETAAARPEDRPAPPDAGSVPPATILPPSLLAAPPPPPDTSAKRPPGLQHHSIRYIRYLPGIYQTDFVSRFLAMFEAILMPIEWNIANFDLYLSPHTAPATFLTWLAYWFGITFDATWSDEQRRLFLAEAHQIFNRRGSKWALQRVLEIYTGRTPEIIDLADDQEPFTFTVRLPLRERDVNRPLIEKIIEADKPAQTAYRLLFSGKVDLDVVWSKLE